MGPKSVRSDVKASLTVFMRVLASEGETESCDGDRFATMALVMRPTFWLEDSAESPDLVAAWLVLGLFPVDRVPWWAARWLASGWDGPTLRELAGLGARQTHEIRDLLPLALAEIGVTLPSNDLDAARIWFRHIAQLCLDGRVDERWVARTVERVHAASGFNIDLHDLPLGGLYGVEDAWIGGWGPAEPELRAMVLAACREQVNAPEK